ncbi:hypothetical protein AJ80_03604 [Polytolypa hystricis UAMH7299]|uniref:NADPH-dependent diflavin oxidoreductase 1 n=1 Tax=Polytolypa hystricis (strain UAMH7299) TaxID=1447883 RepID=A0A2B7YFM9_POLH7|nr:hypothetical protein AJ80_03604 [Polytolypa hystricis UAMH7299]
MAGTTSSNQSTSRTALILYGSETGNSQDVAEELGRLAERLHFTTHVSELDAVKADSLKDYSLTIFALSTTGQGDFPANGRVFWKSLLLKRLPPTYLEGVNFTLFGLGDSSYPKFNWASRKLHKRLLQLGANEIYPGGGADEQHPEGLEGSFVPWSLDLRKYLLDKFPLPHGQHPIPDDVRLPPKWILASFDADLDGKMKIYPSPSTSEKENLKKLDEGSESERIDHDVRPIPNTVVATLKQNGRMTPQDHWQDVRHLKLTVSESITYVPGDILHITPKNFATNIDTLISIMGWEDVADQPLCFIPNPQSPAPAELSAPQIPFLRDWPGFTLRTLFTDYLDIMAIPRRSFFSSIAHFTDDSMHKERLLEFTDPEYIDEFYDYTTRPRRSILEILEEFDSVKVPWQQACTVFPILRDRQFSIASGGELKRVPSPSADGGGGGGGTSFDLLVAIVKYQTVIRKTREGVCTRYLSVLQPGSTLKVKVQKGGLNTSVKQLLNPCVLVGPGTGLAPLRSLLWEKAAMAQTFRNKHGPDTPVPMGPIILLFGGRNRHADFFFENEYRALSRVLDLKVFTAFSRDQKQKVYVQDIIRQNSRDFFRILCELQGMVYICGSSGKMPQAIREALIECFQNPDGGAPSTSGSEDASEREVGGVSTTRQAAEKYFMDMEKVGRYKQETW